MLRVLTFLRQWYPKLCEYDKDGWHSNLTLENFMVFGVIMMSKFPLTQRMPLVVLEYSKPK